jgi:hypothetical protein
MSELLCEREYCDTSQHMAHNIQEEQRHQPYGRGSLKSCMDDNIERGEDTGHLQRINGTGILLMAV